MCCTLFPFQVFETSVSQEQLPVLSGWIFEALCHLLTEKVSSNLLPYTLLSLLVSASSRHQIRDSTPLAYAVLREGFYRNMRLDDNWGVFKEFLGCDDRMSFTDRRLLCVVGSRSDFTAPQLVRLKELCLTNECLGDLLQCLNV